MAHALNLVLKLKQDQDTQAKLQELKKVFATQVQPAIEKALRRLEKSFTLPASL